MIKKIGKSKGVKYFENTEFFSVKSVEVKYIVKSLVQKYFKTIIMTKIVTFEHELYVNGRYLTEQKQKTIIAPKNSENEKTIIAHVRTIILTIKLFRNNIKFL